MSAGREIVMTPERVQQYLLLLDLAADVVSPEGYGHSLPAEVVKRTARILRHAPLEPIDDLPPLPFIPADPQQRLQLVAWGRECARLS